MTHSHAQNDDPYNVEISVNTDNDALVAWKNKDIYYTYGIGAQVAFQAEHLLALERLFPSKTSHFFKTGLRMEGYTPSNKFIYAAELVNVDEVFDRPFAGLLYGTMEASYIFENSTLTTGMLFGILGPSSRAGDLQIWFHESVTDDALIDGWEFQLPDQLLLNFNMAYTYDFTPKSKIISAYGGGEVHFGNLYVKAVPSLGVRIGKFAPLTRSVAVDNSILLKRNETELFFLAKYDLAVNLFNATAQGKLFGPNNNLALSTINTVDSLLTLGIYFTYYRWTVNFNHYFSFGKVIPKTNHVYARIGLFHRF
ncbi:MAG: DUF2219 family protein [Eudoraea sp.]|nr:DUF2219 family protein [Eudoraea sp.]